MIVLLFLEKYLWIFRITTYCDDFNLKSSVKQVKIVFLSFQICYNSYIDDNCIILSSKFLNIPRNIRNIQRLFSFSKIFQLCPVQLSQLGVLPCIKRLPVRFPIRAYALFVGSILVGGVQEETDKCFTLMSMFLPLLLSIKINLKIFINNKSKDIQILNED